MTSYTVTVELDQAADADLLTRAVDVLQGHHPAAGRSVRGRAEVTITVPAEHVHGATMTALGLVAVHQLGEPVAVHTQTSADHDRDLGLEPIPELLSVTEVAEQLGITRTAVQQRIDAGSLPAQRVGKTWALPRRAVEGKMRQYFEQWWHRLSGADRIHFIDQVHAGQYDQRMITMMSEHRAPLGPIFSSWVGNGEDDWQVTSLGPVVDFVMSLPEYEQEGAHSED